MASRMGPRDRADRDLLPAPRPVSSVGLPVYYSTLDRPVLGMASRSVGIPERTSGGFLPTRRDADLGRAEPLSAPLSTSAAAGTPAGVARGGPAGAQSPPSSAGPTPESSRRDSVARALEAFGLRKATSKLYCAALAMGPSLPLEVIVNARVPRATGYRGLERLRRLELVVPVAHRPLRIEAVPLSRLLDRSAVALLDEVALHREMREVAADSLSLPSPPRGPRGPVLIGPAEAARALRDSLALARRELLMVPVLRGLPAETRAALRDGLDQAVARGVHVRILVPNEPTYFRALPAVARSDRTDPHLERRLSEPPFFHLYVIDAVRAIRFFVRSTPTDRPSGTLGVVSDRPTFVQSQEERFRSLWADAPSVEAIEEGDSLVPEASRRGAPRSRRPTAGHDLSHSSRNRQTP